MSIVRVLPVAVVAAALVAACSDVSTPTQSMPVASSLRASEGSGGGGGGGGTQLVVTTPPTVNATGTWVGTSDGPDVAHTCTFTLNQAGAGMVSGSGTMTTPFMNASYLVVGTVNADTLMLYTGTDCSSCTLDPFYRGIVSADGSCVDGNLLNGGVSPLTLFKQSWHSL